MQYLLLYLSSFPTFHDVKFMHLSFAQGPMHILIGAPTSSRLPHYIQCDSFAISRLFNPVTEPGLLSPSIAFIAFCYAAMTPLFCASSALVTRTLGLKQCGVELVSDLQNQTCWGLKRQHRWTMWSIVARLLLCGGCNAPNMFSSAVCLYLLNVRHATTTCCTKICVRTL